MIYLAFVFLLFSPLALAADNAHLVQTNVNVQQNTVESNKNSNNNNNVDNAPSPVELDSATSPLAVQPQDVLPVQQQQQQQLQQQQQQDAQQALNQQQQQLQQQQPQPQSQPIAPGSQPPQQAMAADPAVQLLKEANAQYQYQINSRYEERTRPIYNELAAGLVSASAAGGPQYAAGQPQPYAAAYGPLPAYPYRRENGQYQELGNGQRRSETNVGYTPDGGRSQNDNHDQSTYTHQRSQSYSEYGKGESSPDYNTYTYKRTYY